VQGALPAEIQRWCIWLYSAYASDKKVIIYRCKRRFFVGICIEKGARSLVGKSERNGHVCY